MKAGSEEVKNFFKAKSDKNEVNFTEHHLKISSKIIICLSEVAA